MSSEIYRRPESVLVVIHTHDGHILLLKRADVENFWQSVTGSLEWGELPRAAAVREVEEETGLAVSDQLVDWNRSVIFDIREQFKPRYAPGVERNVEYMFSVEIELDRPLVISSKEHTAFRWCHHGEAVDVVWSWSNRAAIELLANKFWK